MVRYLLRHRQQDLPRALMTGTERTLHVAVTCAPHFFVSCVSTHPTGEHPSWTRTRFPMQFVSSNSADCNAVRATQPLYGRLAAPSKPMINGLRDILDSEATTNWEANPAAYHGAASQTSSPISRPLFEFRPTPSTMPAHARPSTNGNSWWSYVLYFWIIRRIFRPYPLAMRSSMRWMEAARTRTKISVDECKLGTLTTHGATF